MHLDHFIKHITKIMGPALEFFDFFHYFYFLLLVGIGVKWQYLQNHVAPDLFYAYRPQNT